MSFLGQNSSHFLLNSITCREYLGDSSPEEAFNVYASLDVPDLAMSLRQLATEFGNCVGMGEVVIDPVDYGTVSSTVPVLVLQGEFDQVISPAASATIEDQLDNVQYVLVPSQGHGVWASDESCVGQIGQEFFADPSATVDTSCLKAQEIDFLIQ